MARPAVTRLVLWGALVLLLALPPLVQGLGADFAVGVATRILIFALVGTSLNLILGYGGLVSFGHAAFFGTGAYVVAILAQHDTYGEPLLTWPIAIDGTQSALIAWPAAMAVSALLALVIGLVALRTSGLYFIMITLAFAQMLYFLFISLRAYGGEDGISLFGRSAAGPLDLGEDVHFYYLVLGLVLLALWLKGHLVASRFGRVLRGIRDNERRMQALGFPTFRYKLVAFVMAGAVAGLSGALIANQTEFVSPGLLHWTRSGEILVMVILGGIGTLFGPVFGAAAFLMLEEVLSTWTEHWMVVLGPVLIFVVLFARRGIYGWLVGREEEP